MVTIECTKNATLVKNIFTSISELVDEGKLRLEKQGMSMAAMDASHIGLVYMSLKANLFEIFNIEEPLELSLNLTDFVKILKRSTSDEQLILNYNQQKNMLEITFKRKNVENAKGRNFKLPLKKPEDIEAEEINMESLMEMNFPNEMVVKVNLLTEAIKDAKIFSEIVNLTAKQSGDKFDVSFNCNDSAGEMEYNIEKGDILSGTINSESSDSYAVQYLEKMIKSTIGDQIQIRFGLTDNPIQLIYKLTENDEPSETIFFLAPRVETDDSMYEGEEDESANEDPSLPQSSNGEDSEDAEDEYVEEIEEDEPEPEEKPAPKAKKSKAKS